VLTGDRWEKFERGKGGGLSRENFVRRLLGGVRWQEEGCALLIRGFIPVGRKAPEKEKALQFQGRTP